MAIFAGFLSSLLFLLSVISFRLSHARKPNRNPQKPTEERQSQLEGDYQAQGLEIYHNPDLPPSSLEAIAQIELEDYLRWATFTHPQGAAN